MNARTKMTLYPLVRLRPSPNIHPGYGDRVVALAALSALSLMGCSEQAVEAAGPRLSVNVAPLSLPGVDDACYSLAVYNAATPGNGELVWQRAGICADRYGDNQASISFVGTCDASGPGGERDNSVRLTLDDLCSGGPCITPGPGATSLASSSWVNPCPAPGGCVLPTRCRENSDTRVEFNLTILRGANQGFFDVAVNFEDIFCSAKFDCESPSGGPIELLHDPATGRRSTTAVLGLACTSGAGSETWLYMNDPVLTCYDAQGAVVSSVAVDPSGGPGNLGPRGELLFQSATYRGSEALEPYEKCYWNMAFGVRESELAEGGGRCELKLRATAADRALPDNRTPANTRYPVIDYTIELNPTRTALSCGKHAINATNSDVQTDYTPLTGERFTHFVACDDPQTAGGTPGRTLCNGQVSGFGDVTSFTVTNGSMVAQSGELQSPAYPLPEGYSLGGCCLDPCCAQ